VAGATSLDDTNALLARVAQLRSTERDFSADDTGRRRGSQEEISKHRLTEQGPPQDLTSTFHTLHRLYPAMAQTIIDGYTLHAYREGSGRRRNKQGAAFHATGNSPSIKGSS